MGQPSINIVFRTLGTTAVQRSKKGIVALLVKDTKANGMHSVLSVTDIPKELSAENQAQVKRVLIGNTNPPKKVVLYVFDGTEKTLDDGLNFLETVKFDYLAPYAETTKEEVEAVGLWVKAQRANGNKVKAVLPNYKADNEGVINFVTSGIKVGEKDITTEAFCSRIAGLLAGTSMLYSATYAALPEVTDVKRLTWEEMDNAADSGEFIIFYDNEKVKAGRAVNSLVTTGAGKGNAFKKAKVVEVMDMIYNDIYSTISDNYIGKYANSYDNKCLVITAIQGYLESLEIDGLLERGKSLVDVDMEKQENYLKANGIDTSEMSEQDMKEANTGSQVFLRLKGHILDAMEDFDFMMTV